MTSSYAFERLMRGLRTARADPANRVDINEATFSRSFQKADGFLLELRRLTPAARKDVLAAAGETHRGMPLRGYLKLAERHDFETIATFDDRPGVTLTVVGRRRDAKVIVLEADNGIVDVAVMRFVHRRSPNFLVANTADTRKSLCTEGLGALLSLYAASSTRPLPFWFTPKPAREKTVMRRLRARSFLVVSSTTEPEYPTYPIVDEIEAAYGRKIAKLGRLHADRVARFPDDWKSILDIAGTRSYEEAVRMADGGG